MTDQKPARTPEQLAQELLQAIAERDEALKSDRLRHEINLKYEATCAGFEEQRDKAEAELAATLAK